jgi:Protein of unknown function (DUF3987)
MPGDSDRLTAEQSVEPFPLCVLPEPLAEFVAEGARAIACPPDYIAVPMLSVLATAIGTRFRLRVKEGWCEWPILWTATVGDTGTAKSPGQEKAVEPLVRVQNKLLSEFEEAVKDRRAKKAASSAARKAATRPGASKAGANSEAVAVDTEDSPPTPHLSQIFTTDTTLEAMNLCLATNPRGIALVRDELTAWVLAMNEYKRGSGADRPHWQSMWNGSPIVVNRKTNGTPIVIPRPFVCVLGGLPPDMLGELCDERGREDGFIHRILFAFPDRVPRLMTDDGLLPATLARYCEVFDKLRRMRGNIFDGPVTLDLAPGTCDRFREWVNAHYAEMESGPPNLRGPWAKLVTYCARLALIIHLIHKVSADLATNDVDAVSVDRAIGLVDYFKSHVRKVYRHLHASAEELAIAGAVDWLKRRPGRGASVRDIVTYKVGQVENSGQALDLLQKLEKNNWGHIERQTPSTGGRETIRFFLDCRSIADRLQTLADGRK